ncbi:hypothetical protein F4780DRAFT_714828 [Xylariomycetidae sp. FL0641]|nr:hypothetical protein F4780DRAFT_714828 [Xylariomycetidae sp. FL0641]
MEPLSALSLCCNILDLADRSVKLVRSFRRIYNACDGVDHGRQHEFVQSIEGILGQWDSSERSLAQTGNTLGEDTIRDVLARIKLIHHELLVLLDTCKAKKAQSTRAAVSAMCRSFRSQGDIEEREKILEQCRQQLNSLLAISSLQHVEAIRRTVTASKYEQEGIKSELDGVASVLRDASSDSTKILECLENIRDASAKAYQRIQTQRLLDRIGNPGDRFDRVREAEEHTFHWLLSEPLELDNKCDSLGGHSTDTPIQPRSGIGFAGSHSKSTRKKKMDDETKGRASAQFTHWLANGSGIFHIVGKPGSGKSTLMKFVDEHPRSRLLLAEWAEGKRLVFAKFFFWKAGTWRQNTLRGLVRGLLYDILEQSPDLGPILFPEWYEHADDLATSPLYCRTSDKECLAALQRMLDMPEAIGDARFCFFIDGLDEFEEDDAAGLTYISLASKLRCWADRAMGKVKLCVSSRELPAFETISRGQQIRLHELTEADIKTLVLATFSEETVFLSLPEKQRDAIIDDIVSQAQGVFLWVVLVSQSVLRGLLNGDSVSRLRSRIRTMPKELGELCKRVLGSIEDCYRFEAILLLCMVMRVQFGFTLSEDRAVDEKERFCISLLGAFLVSKAIDRSAGDETAFQHHSIGLYDEAIETFDREATTAIAGRFHGILEVRWEMDAGDSWSEVSCVDLTHRSVVEFLRSELSGSARDLTITDSLVAKAIFWMLAEEIEYHCSMLRARTNPIHYYNKMWVDVEKAFRVLSPGYFQTFPDDPYKIMEDFDAIDRGAFELNVQYPPWIALSPPLEFPGKHAVYILQMCYTTGPLQYVARRFQAARLLPEVARLGVKRILLHALAQRTREAAEEGGLAISPDETRARIAFLVRDGLDINADDPLERSGVSTFENLWCDATCFGLHVGWRRWGEQVWGNIEVWLSFGAIPSGQISIARDDFLWYNDKVNWIRGVSRRELPEVITFEDAVVIVNPPNRDRILGILREREKSALAAENEAITSNHADDPNSLPAAVKGELTTPRDSETHGLGGTMQEKTLISLAPVALVFLGLAIPAVVYTRRLWLGRPTA